MAIAEEIRPSSDTLLGGPAAPGDAGIDAGRGIAVDDGGHAYIVGLTESRSFPTKNAF